jgi:hypothetical protein
VAALTSVWAPSSPVPPLITATTPLAAFLIFGTQMDVFTVWWICGSRKPRDFDKLVGESEKSETASKVRQDMV